MSRRLLLPLLLLCFLGANLLLACAQPAVLNETPPAPVISGTVLDRQGQPVREAEVALLSPDAPDLPLSTATTQPDGRYALLLPDRLPDSLTVHISRHHFRPAEVPLQGEVLRTLQKGDSVALPPVILERRIGAAFWVATVVFIVMLVLIATARLHHTLAAMVGAAEVLAISYLGGPLWDDLYIFDFHGALGYVDWNVIFLIMGMMILIAVVERTGLFQWLALMAYRLSGGRTWLLLPILLLVTGIASAFLDNVTTMLLMTPITVQIALAIEVNPLAFLIPEVMASNVAGASTLVGTPTNILIGSYGHISFNDFLGNLTPGVLLALLGLIVYSELIYRRDLRQAGKASDLLLLKLSERARITEPDHLKKAGWVGLGMLLLFIFGERIHLTPAVTALIGATALLLWIRPNVEEMIEAVDWTTLVFFMALFITVGAIQEVGLISIIAGLIGRLVGGSLLLAMLLVIWLSALLSTVVANTPLTAAMLPVVGYLTAIVPGAESKALFYCLSVGSAMGGNGSLIGASANMVTAGISERAGYPITYLYFLKKGMPALLVSTGLATLWLLLHFLL